MAAAVAAADTDPECRRLLATADALLAPLAAALPPACLLLVLSGQGNTALTRALHGECLERKERERAGLLQAWRDAANASPHVKALVQRAKAGVALLAATPA